MSLAEFLLARIAEDEAVARAATEGPWEVRPYWFTSDSGRPYAASVPGVINNEIDTEDAAHIARHDPARVLAECEAKRRVIDACSWGGFERVKVRPGVYEQRAVRQIRSDDLDACAEVLWRMALPYADHPDYDEAWRP